MSMEQVLRRIPVKEKLPSFYFAGKIKHASEKENDWRAPLLTAGLFDAHYYHWETQPQAVLRTFPYVGPFTTLGKHGGDFDSYVVDACMEAINKADIIFAWIEGSTAYGTLFELGVARALEKRIWLATPATACTCLKIFSTDEDGWESYEIAQDCFWCQCWFTRHQCEAEHDSDSPESAFRFFLDKFNLDVYLKTESPMEALLLTALKKHGLTPHCQFALPPYRLDFAFPEYFLAIEVDGHDFHSTKEQRGKDASRDRYLTRIGWQVMRFTGSEVFNKTTQCAAEIAAFIQSRQQH